MLRLYGSVNSRAMRTLWMLGELGIPYDHKNWDPRSPETRTPEFYALNPNGRVPTIDDDGFVLYESMAINLYLAKKHGKLYPAGAGNEALALQWSFWETDRLDRQITEYVRHTSMLPPAERKADIAEKTWAEIVVSFNILEGALKKAEWLAGPAFSVGDLNVASALYRALSVDTKQWPALTAWLNRCWERPAAKATRALREQK